jgi:hypothetical protein
LPTGRGLVGKVRGPTKGATVKRNATRAARLLILRDLDRAGYLEGLTLQAIGDRLQVHRSTVLRDLRDLPEVTAELERLRALWRDRR